MNYDNQAIAASAAILLIFFCGAITLSGLFRAYKQLHVTTGLQLSHLFEFVMATILILCGVAILVHGSFSLITNEKESGQEALAATSVNFVTSIIIYALAFTPVWLCKRVIRHLKSPAAKA